MSFLDPASVIAPGAKVPQEAKNESEGAAAGTARTTAPDPNSDDPTVRLRAEQEQAQKVLERTGSLPSNWYPGCSVKYKLGRRRHFETAQQFLEQGLEYFKKCAADEIVPTANGMYFYLGFSGVVSYHGWARRNPDMREPHSVFQTLLKMPLEALLLDSTINTSGAWKRLTNIPDGWEEDEDPALVGLRFEFKDRKANEITTGDGASLEVVAGDKSAAELFREMQKAGRKLVTKSDGSNGDPS